MRKIVRRILGILGLPGDLDLLLVTFGVPGGLTVLTTWLAQRAGESAHWIIVAAALVFAATMVSLVSFFALKRLLGVFERVSVSNIAILGASLGRDDEKSPPNALRALTIGVEFKNTGSRMLYMRVKRADLSIAGTVRQGAPFKGVVTVVSPGDTTSIICATLPDIPMGNAPLLGRIELEVEYGPSRESLRFLYHYIGKPQIGYQLDAEKNTAELKIGTAIEDQTHTRSGVFS